MQTITTATGGGFTFQIEGDEAVYTLPRPAEMPLSKLRKLIAAAAVEDETQRTLALIDGELELLYDYMGEAAYSLTGEQVRLIMDAWNGDGLGE